MKKIILGIIWIWIILGFGMDAAFAQFIQNSSRSLFSDVKAFKAGDAIMVLIMEDTQANNSATTNDQRDSKITGTIGASGSTSGIKGDLSLGTGNSFKGTASTERNESIRSKLSARVLQVDNQSGNLMIEGKRTTKVNGENQTIFIKGIVRPVDVMSDNSVYSYNVLDLTLTIEGDGTVSKVQEPGLITKFLRILF